VAGLAAIRKGNTRCRGLTSLGTLGKPQLKERIGAAMPDSDLFVIPLPVELPWDSNSNRDTRVTR
jgi:hypothetical protein